MQVTKLTPTALSPSSLGTRGPGRPKGVPGRSVAETLVSSAVDGSMINGGNKSITLNPATLRRLSKTDPSLKVPLQILGMIQVAMPVYLSIEEQMAIVSPAIAAGDQEAFRAAMDACAAVQGHKKLPLAAAEKPLTLTGEALAEGLVRLCALVRSAACMCDDRVQAALKTVEEEKAAAKAAAEAVEKGDETSDETSGETDDEASDETDDEASGETDDEATD